MLQALPKKMKREDLCGMCFFAGAYIIFIAYILFWCCWLVNE